MIAEAVLDIARDLRDRGGRALVVGGWVRDRLLRLETQDVDVEVYGLTLETLEEALQRHGEVVLQLLDGMGQGRGHAVQRRRRRGEAAAGVDGVEDLQGVEGNAHVENNRTIKPK